MLTERPTLPPQETDIEVDENGTLDLSMKKAKKDGGQSPHPSSSPSTSSHSSQHLRDSAAQGNAQVEWEEPLDFTKPSGTKEDEADEVGSRWEAGLPGGLESKSSP